MSTRFDRRFAGGLIALGLAVSCTGLVELPGETGDGFRGRTPNGIALEPPSFLGERALACETDHAPLRRLNHREYVNTLRDLFPDQALPELTVAIDARREGFTNHFLSQEPTVQQVRHYQENAEGVAAVVDVRIFAEAGCASGEDCLRQIVTDLGARAYRRPLTAAEIEEHVTLLSVADGDLTFAVELSVALFLQAPSFVYRPEFGGADREITPHEIASRLSYFIWSSMPDQALLNAADEGRLAGADLEAEVTRMLADPRAREGLLAATSEWIELGRLDSMLKGEAYDFTPEIRRDLAESLQRFLWDRVFAEDGSLEELFTSSGAYVNARIGPIFGIDDATEDFEWREVPNRSGMLTHPALLAIGGYGTYPSPVRRGVFLLTEILCDAPSPPPDGVDMGEPETETETGEPLTNRAGYEQLTEGEALCRSCHDSINPFGYAFEAFDTVGAYRTEDNGSPIDSSGSSAGFSLDTTFEFERADQLTQQLSESNRVRACVVDRWVRYATGGGALAYNPCLREELDEIAMRPGASLREIVIAIALNPRFTATEIVE